MSDLDNKLKAILLTYYAPATYAVKEVQKRLETKVAQIHKAFAEEGYRKRITLVHDDGSTSHVDVYKDEYVPANQPKKMTGQEWYERFLRQYHASADWINSDESMGDDAEHDVLHAARMASGLDE